MPLNQTAPLLDVLLKSRMTGCNADPADIKADAAGEAAAGAAGREDTSSVGIPNGDQLLPATSLQVCGNRAHSLPLVSSSSKGKFRASEFPWTLSISMITTEQS